MDALANSGAQRRNLEPSDCVWTHRGPTLTVGDKEMGHGWSVFPHIFHGEPSELGEKYGLARILPRLLHYAL